MADKNISMLLLDAEPQLTCPDANKWCPASNNSVSNFIDGIVTSMGSNDKEAKEKYRTMISGVPSPWARVTITQKALDTDQNKKNVLAKCYELFKSEWRGLMAAYVLRQNSFEFSKPIQLVGKSVENNGGEMSVLGTYGDMLFESAPFWVHKCEKKDRIQNPPCIQILYYKLNGEKIAVGATSPFTFLFSSSNYNLSLAKDIPWIDNDGKFVDPISKGKDFLTEEEKQRLYAFIRNIDSMLLPDETDNGQSRKFYKEWMQGICEANGLNKSVVSFVDKFHHTLNSWAEEIEKALGGNTNANVPIDTARPEGPLSLLLNSEKVFYLSGATLYLESQQDGQQIKSTEVFLDSEYIAAWKDVNDGDRDLSKAPVYYLKAGTGDNCYYVALPFTEKALRVFRNALHEIMNDGADLNLVGTVIPGSTPKVEVKLYAKLNRQGTAIPVCQHTYTLEVVPETDGKVFIWPDFVSPLWKNYYYYSEFPTNVYSGIRMVPVFSGEDAPSFLTEDQQRRNYTNYLVQYPVGEVETTAHKYEVIKSDSSLDCVRIFVSKAGVETLAGTLIIKKDCYKRIDESPSPANVGIDFGSTNTCAYYNKTKEGGKPTPIKFSNRRMALVGFDNRPKELAQKDELFFISNEGTLNDNGQVKSWLHLHKPEYLNPLKEGDTHRAKGWESAPSDREIVGGVPVNESNIDVKSMDEYVIITNAGQLRYNLKWLSEDLSKKQKRSFISMLWIHICADMLAESVKPDKLYWSFPSAMSSASRNSLKQIYKDATSNGPFVPKLVEYTEAEADCAYASQKSDNIDSRNIVLGIDVGGSTSDILILGQGNTLFSQTSVRIAAGFFFNAIKNSGKFRRSLLNFNNSRKTNVRISKMEDIISNNPEIYGRAPYYLNNIFDQLKPEEFYTFYSHLNTDVPAIFALPAYVTGMLVYYCGMLVNNAIKENNLRAENVTIRYYGKGGRLFDWIRNEIYSEAGEVFYKDCFRAGFGTERNLNLRFGEIVKTENKSEVAIGLVSDIENRLGETEKDESGNRIIKSYDIVGEEGVELMTGSGYDVLDPLALVPEKMFQKGINAEFPTEMKNFNKFIDIFINFVKTQAILSDTRSIKDGLSKVNVTSFIQNDAEYRNANSDSNSDSHYCMPVIIAEALDFLNKILLPLVSKEMDA